MQRRSSISISPNRRSLPSSVGSPVMTVDTADQHAEEEQETFVPQHRQIMGCIPECAMETTSETESETESETQVEVIEDSVSEFSSPELPLSPPVRILRGRLGQRRNPLQDLSNLSNSCTNANSFKETSTKSVEPSPSSPAHASNNTPVNRCKTPGFVVAFASASDINNSDSVEPVRRSAGVQILLNGKQNFYKIIIHKDGYSRICVYNRSYKILTLIFSFQMIPFLIKQFKLHWGYVKNLVSSFFFD